MTGLASRPAVQASPSSLFTVFAPTVAVIECQAIDIHPTKASVRRLPIEPAAKLHSVIDCFLPVIGGRIRNAVAQGGATAP